MKSDTELLEASKSWTQRQRERRRREGKCAWCETPSPEHYACLAHRRKLAAQALARKRGRGTGAVSPGEPQ
jgi:hypothetical protein